MNPSPDDPEIAEMYEQWELELIKGSGLSDDEIESLLSLCEDNDP